MDTYFAENVRSYKVNLLKYTVAGILIFCYTEQLGHKFLFYVHICVSSPDNLWTLEAIWS